MTLLRALVEHYADRPNLLPTRLTAPGLTAGSVDAYRAAVQYVGGMTDRYACRAGVTELGWDASKLPLGVE